MDKKQEKAAIIGGKIKSLREHLGLSQQEFAKRIGHSQQYISHCERGYRLATTDLLLDICEKFNISLDQFDPNKPSQDQASTFLVLERISALEEAIAGLKQELSKHE